MSIGKYLCINYGEKSKSKGNNKKKQTVSSSGSESGAPPANLSPANNSTESNGATSAADLLERRLDFRLTLWSASSLRDTDKKSVLGF